MKKLLVAYVEEKINMIFVVEFWIGSLKTQLTNTKTDNTEFEYSMDSFENH